MESDDIIVAWEGPTIAVSPEDDLVIAWEDDGPVATFESS